MKAPLDSRQLRAFVALAQTGSFTVAAKELFLSQSAVSHSMKALEQDVGCRLFDRVGKKVLLTQAGEHFLQHADKILSEMNSARSSLEQLRKWGWSRLRIGASLAACEYILPPVLRQLQEKFPHCLINVGSLDTAEAAASLRASQIDLALVLQPQHEEQIEFQPLFADELRFVVAPSHAWAVAGKVNRAEVPRQSYFLYRKASYTFRIVEEFLRSETVAVNTMNQVSSMTAIKELVKAGLGVSILAPWIAHKELEEGSLVSLPLGKRKLQRTWGIAIRAGRRLTIAEETFIALCRSTIANEARFQRVRALGGEKLVLSESAKNTP